MAEVKLVKVSSFKGINAKGEVEFTEGAPVPEHKAKVLIQSNGFNMDQLRAGGPSATGKYILTSDLRGTSKAAGKANETKED